MFSKLVNKIKDIKFPIVLRKKYETALKNNKIMNSNRLELSKKNIELQHEVNLLKEQKKEREKLIDYLETELDKAKQCAAKSERSYKNLVDRTKKEVVSKHCIKCGRFFRISSINSNKKYCPTCTQKLKEERKNGRTK